MVLDDFLEFGDFFGVGFGTVPFFGGIFFEIKKQGDFAIEVLDFSLAGGFDVEFPVAYADGMEFTGAVEEKRIALMIAGAFFEDLGDVASVNSAVLGGHDTCEVEGGGEDVHGAGGFAANDSCGDFSGPPGDAGFADAAFPGGAFAVAEVSGGAAFFVFDDPGAVVGGENDEGVFIESLFL